MGLKLGVAAAVAIALAVFAGFVKHWHTEAGKVPELKARIVALEQDLGIARSETDSYATELDKLNRIYDQLQQKHSIAVLQAQEIAAAKKASERELKARLEELRASIPVPGTSCEEITQWELESLPRSW